MIGTKIRELMEQNRVRNKVLADALGISYSRLSNYLTNKRDPGIHLLAKIAKYLNVDVNYFVDSLSLSESSPYLDKKSDESVVIVPLLNINAKKNETKRHFIPIGRDFLKGVSEDSSIVFEVNTSIGGNEFTLGDRILVAKVNDSHIKSGELLIEAGRNAKVYRLIKTSEDFILVSAGYRGEQRIITEEELQNLYSVLWIFKNQSIDAESLKSVV